MWPLAVLTGDRKEICGRFAGLNKMGVMSRLPYYRGGRKAGSFVLVL